MPADDSDIPVGSGAPLASTPNAPPRAIPDGSVGARSNVAPPPATKNGHGLTFHAWGVAGGDGVGDGEGVGEGAGRGGGEGVGVGDGLGEGAKPGASETAGSTVRPQPNKRLAQPNRPIFKALRRLAFCIPVFVQNSCTACAGVGPIGTHFTLGAIPPFALNSFDEMDDSSGEDRDESNTYIAFHISVF